MTDDTSISACVGEYVANGIQAMREDITDELKIHGKAVLTFKVRYKQLESGEIEVDLERRLAHSPDVVKTSVGKLRQQSLPGIGG
jgi:hypothetical protein